MVGRYTGSIRAPARDADLSQLGGEAGALGGVSAGLARQSVCRYCGVEACYTLFMDDA